MAANPFLTPEEKARIGRAVIGVAGAGGLGSNCAMHLVRAGVERLVIADFDTVNATNLNRQFFFHDQLDMLKVDALRDNLLRIEPGLQLRTVADRITAANAPAVFAECDIVVEAFDRAEVKQMFIETMLAAGKTVIAASGLAGFGRSNAMRLRKACGGRLYLIGDLHSGVESAPPSSPRVNIAAAMEANTVLALLTGNEP